MSTPQWITPAGFIGTYTQGNSFIATGTNITLPFRTSAPDAQYSVISGILPAGLNLYKNGIIYGTPVYVNVVTRSEFVIRAANATGVSDRTFIIDVEGPRAPVWDTEEGLLPVGPNLEYYAVNKNIVSIQLRASTVIVPKGQTLRYYLKDGTGTLPPGLTLSESGRISGVVDDILQLNYNASTTGGYDDDNYDAFPYEYIVIDASTHVGTRPESVSKIYQFTVIATDGVSNSERIFKIKVDDPNSLRVDNSFIDVDTAIYSADIGYLIPPVWLGVDNSELPDPANLGTLRANNYEIIYLKDYDPYPYTGPVSFDWLSRTFNPEIRLITDSVFNIAGTPTANLQGNTEIVVKSTIGVPQVGMEFKLDSYVPNADTTTYIITSVIPNGTGYILGLGFNTTFKGTVLRLIDLPRTANIGDVYQWTNSGDFDPVTGQQIPHFVCYDPIIGWGGSFTLGVPGRDLGPAPYNTVQPGMPLYIDIPDSTQLYCGSHVVYPPGLSLNTSTGVLYGELPYQPAYTQNYRFTVRITKTDYNTQDTVFKDQIFNLTLKGNVESTIEFVTTSTLTPIIPGFQSELQIVATHIGDQIPISYLQTNGKLPPGLSLETDGNIIGRVGYGHLTTFDSTITGYNSLLLDKGITTLDRQFTFEVTASDAFRLSSVSQTFEIKIADQSAIPYTSLYFKPLLASKSRQYYRTFVQDSNIFDATTLYRPNDPAFGVQQQIKMYLEYGLQTLNLDNYLPAMTNYFKRKRFYFGSLQTAVAKDAFDNVVYEVIYVNLIDDQMVGSVSASTSFQEKNNGVLTTFYPDSVINMQTALETLAVGTGFIKVDNMYRPKFMQTIQDTTGVPLGFVKAAILCYAMPGKSQTILDKIKNSGYDFKQLDFDIDRMWVDSSLDNATTKYLMFGTSYVSTEFNIVAEDFNPALDPNISDLTFAGQDIDTEDGSPLTI